VRSDSDIIGGDDDIGEIYPSFANSCFAIVTERGCKHTYVGQFGLFDTVVTAQFFDANLCPARVASVKCAKRDTSHVHACPIIDFSRWCEIFIA
jgi:hypothetical protein